MSDHEDVQLHKNGHRLSGLDLDDHDQKQQELVKSVDKFSVKNDDTDEEEDRSDLQRGKPARKDSISSNSSHSNPPSEAGDEDISASTTTQSHSHEKSMDEEDSKSGSKGRSKKSTTVSSDTDDDQDEDEDLPKDPPVPVIRQVSLPPSDRAEPAAEDELSREERELSKRETVHLAEDGDQPQLQASNGVRKASSSSMSSSSSSEAELDKKDDAVVASNEHNLMHSSRNEEEEEVLAANEEDEPVSLRHPANGSVTKAYMAALNNNNNNENEHDRVSKAERASKGVKDITQMYVESLAKSNTPPASPKAFTRTKPAKDITQLYTGSIEHASPGSNGGLPDKLSPKKHNMATDVDRDAIRQAYDDVRSDTSETEWAVFKFDGNRLCVTATGNDFAQFKSLFGNDDRGFGYIRIKTGDEMSKRCKFVLVTWVGPTVSVMKKAKMSTDKALMKDIIQNLSVELQLENHGEFNYDYFKGQVDKAAGARYGTGVRDH